jgi:hypothetical protein
MRTATLRFVGNSLYITGGIRVHPDPKPAVLGLFANPGRILPLPMAVLDPPMRHAPDPGEPEEVYLASLSLRPGQEAGLEATKERDAFDQVLLLVDTRDDHAVDCQGRYLVHARHDRRLPHARLSTARGEGDLGLVVCAEGDALLVASTGGRTAKVTLGPGNHWAASPCDKEDRLLLKA